MSKILPTNNLLHSFRLIFRMQRTVGIFPYCVKADRLYITAGTFLRTMILPTIYICYVLYNCVVASFRITGTEIAIFNRVFAEFFYVSLVFLANYKCHLQRKFFEQLQTVDAIMEEQLRLQVDHRRVFWMTLKGFCAFLFLSGLKISYSLKAWTPMGFLHVAGDLVRLQINSINALTYFVSAYAIMVRMEQLSDHLVTCIDRKKWQFPQSQEPKEQMIINVCTVHDLLRNAVAQMNTMNAMRVVLTYFHEAIALTLSFYYIYSALVGSGVLLPMFTMVLNATVLVFILLTLSIFCHRTIRFIELAEKKILHLAYILDNRDVIELVNQFCLRNRHNRVNFTVNNLWKIDLTHIWAIFSTIFTSLLILMNLSPTVVPS